MKKMNTCFLVRVIILVNITVLFFGGCAIRSNAPTKFYTLSPMPVSEGVKQDESVNRQTAIGIGPIRIPAYLDRPEIVTRISPNELQLAELDNWAEPLSTNLTRVLVENLTRLLRTKSVFIFPGESSPRIDYRIDVEVVQMDGELGGDASLVARWEILDMSSESILLTKRSHYTESVDGSDYTAFTAAQSRMVETFSRDIAKTLTALLQ